MTQLFLKLLNMSITASWIVLAVMVLRLFLRKAPKWICCVLWSVVALRLILPFSVQSVISLVPSPEVIPQDIVQSQTPAIYSGIPAVNSAVNPLFTGYLTPERSLLERGLFLAAVLWAIGVGAMLLYSLFASWKIRRQVRGSVRYDKNIYVCDDVESPFILGTVMPKIYIPSGMEQMQLSYVLAHENAHIKRGDHWWKPLGFLLLSVYWFNPLLWVAYIRLCRDIELACDEKVIAGMDNNGKLGYSEALVACSVHRRTVMACPLAFGEINVKSRVRSVLRYKKPAIWVALTALAVCVVTAGCFLTNPLPCDHTYESAVLVETTCTSRGVEKRTCSQCRHMYTAYVDICEHSYGQSQVTVAPTCTQQGCSQQTCTHCGAVKTAALAITPHTLGEPFVVREPNCTQEGQRSAACLDCAQVFPVEVLAANDVHDMKETVLREPTCADPGEGVNACTRCDHAERICYQTVSHNYADGAVFLATCAKEGIKQKVCTGCGHEVWISLPVNDAHSWTEVRKGFYQCMQCGCVKTDPGYSSDYSLFGDCVGSASQPSEDTALPVVRWDVRP